MIWCVILTLILIAIAVAIVMCWKKSIVSLEQYETDVNDIESRELFRRYMKLTKRMAILFLFLSIILIVLAIIYF